MPLYFTGGGVVLAPIAGQNVITSSADNVSPLTLLRHSNTQSAAILPWYKSDGTTLLGQIMAAGGVSLATGISLDWNSDLFLQRDAANTLALRNGANAQTFRTYFNYVDASNYNRLELRYSAGWIISPVIAGTGGGANNLNVLAGAGNNLYLGGNNSASWTIDFNGNLTLQGAGDNLKDLGASGNNRPRTGYFGTSVIAPVFTSNLGASTGTMNGVGQANVQTSAAGVGNGADTTDDTLFTYSLPINAMSANGKALLVRATGQFAANANPKEVKLWFGGTVISDSGILTLSGKTWTVTGEIIRVDATHVSVIGQFAGDTASVQDVTVTPNLVVADLTANATVLKVTGASTTIGAASDVLGYSLRAEFAN